MLVVVGDVSGKGLKAAMTVSAIVGSLRMLPTRTPAEILRELNRSLAGNLRRGLLVTCLAIRIRADGAVTLANGGHLAPYLNGEELPTPPSLPLGITTDAEYTEISLRLAPVRYVDPLLRRSGRSPIADRRAFRI